MCMMSAFVEDASLIPQEFSADAQRTRLMRASPGSTSVPDQFVPKTELLTLLRIKYDSNIEAKVSERDIY